nr:MAG TPA: hypothetical protein [Caudoviricetes sp.]
MNVMERVMRINDIYIMVNTKCYSYLFLAIYD